jgi:putative CocE/NonD family hydrolase
VKGVAHAPWFETWIRENLATADYWRRISYQGEEHYSRMTVPSLNITGWFDANFPGSPMNYMGMKRHGATPAARRPQLVVGPWSHLINTRKLLAFDYGPDAVIDLNGVICRWFDHYLKGIDNGADRDPPVRLFVMGSNRWIAADDWPLPQTAFTRYYLHSGGRANTLSGDGTLTVDPPADEPPDSYVYDPADPTPDSFDKGPDGKTLAVRQVGHIEGAVDTRRSAARDDVLVYQTPPLAADLELVGPIEATLFAATSARDTDWMMRLVDVHPDGYAALLADGVLRARCRDPERAGRYNPDRLSVIEPDRVYEYTLNFWRGVGNVFKAGHRIRIEVSSGYYPYYLRNLNTGADNVGLETRWVTARQKIFHDAKHPSSVLLPVIPPRPPAETGP